MYNVVLLFVAHYGLQIINQKFAKEKNDWFKSKMAASTHEEIILLPIHLLLFHTRLDFDGKIYGFGISEYNGISLNSELYSFHDEIWY